MVTHEGVLDAFGGLKWWYREFEPTAPELLLSDLPIHWEGGFDKPDFTLLLPIADCARYDTVRGLDAAA